MLPSIIFSLAVVLAECSWKELIEPKRIITKEATEMTKFMGTKNIINNFVILKHSGNQVIIGGRNNIYKIIIDDLKEIQRLTWHSTFEDIKMCFIKGNSEDKCENYLRIYADITKHFILVCGTNAFKPLCRKYKKTHSKYMEIEEFSGVGLCPYSPYYNSTTTFADGELYAATFGRFTGDDPLIYRKRIANGIGVRTIEGDSNQLNQPSFIASFHHEKFVYFFFKEESVEAMHSGKVIYSRVARVCTNDNGYGNYGIVKHWTSFFKTRITCTVPGNFPFHFDEIHAVSGITEIIYNKKVEQIIYAVFATSPNAPTGSAVCAFLLKDIEKSFEGDFKKQKERDSNWLPVPTKEVPSPRPGKCLNTSFSEKDLLFIRQNCLMNENIHSFLREPILIYLDVRCILTAIAVDPQVETVNGKKYDVIFVGTNCGRILKAIYLPMDSLNIFLGNNVKKIVLEEIQVFNQSTSITNLLVYGNKLMVISQFEILTISTHRCEQNAKNCSECVELQDPYCAWDIRRNICTKWNSEIRRSNSFIQNIENEKSYNCNLVIDDFEANASEVIRTKNSGIIIVTSIVLLFISLLSIIGYSLCLNKIKCTTVFFVMISQLKTVKCYTVN